MAATVGALLRFDSRKAVRAWATWGYHHHNLFTYTEGPDRWHWVLSWRTPEADCSAFASGDFKHAGTDCPYAPGTDYAPADTQTYLDTLAREPESHAIYGDVVVYGAESPVSEQHMAVVVGRISGRVMVIGHGEQGCPCFGPADADPRSRTYLRVKTLTRNRVTYPPRNP